CEMRLISATSRPATAPKPPATRTRKISRERIRARSWAQRPRAWPVRSRPRAPIMNRRAAAEGARSSRARAFERQPDWGPAHPVDGRGPEGFQGFGVTGRAIALVRREAVAGVDPVHFGHKPVPGRLGQD